MFIDEIAEIIKQKQTIDFIHMPSDTAIKLFFYVEYMGHVAVPKDHRIERSSYGNFLLIATISGKGYLTSEEKIMR